MIILLYKRSIKVVYKCLFYYICYLLITDCIAIFECGPNLETHFTGIYSFKEALFTTFKLHA